MLSAPTREERSILDWRLERLLDMGFTVGQAEILAASPVDLHEVKKRLLERGCSHDVAYKILR